MNSLFLSAQQGGATSQAFAPYTSALFESAALWTRSQDHLHFLVKDLRGPADVV
jgi:hypothetical protein